MFYVQDFLNRFLIAPHKQTTRYGKAIMTGVQFTLPPGDELRPIIDEMTITPETTAKITNKLDDDQTEWALLLLKEMLYGYGDDDASGIFNSLVNHLGSHPYTSDHEFIELIYNTVRPLLTLGLHYEGKPDDEPEITKETPQDVRNAIGPIKAARDKRNHIRGRVSHLVISSVVPNFIEHTLKLTSTKIVKIGSAEQPVFPPHAVDSTHATLKHRWLQRNSFIAVR